jgi:hypothetical protein
MIGAIDRACRVAFRARAARASAVSAAVPARPRKPPSCFPRALLAANAAFVRAKIMPASSSATAIKPAKNFTSKIFFQKIFAHYLIICGGLR